MRTAIYGALAICQAPCLGSDQLPLTQAAGQPCKAEAPLTPFPRQVTEAQGSSTPELGGSTSSTRGRQNQSLRSQRFQNFQTRVLNGTFLKVGITYVYHKMYCPSLVSVYGSAVSTCTSWCDQPVFISQN